MCRPIKSPLYNALMMDDVDALRTAIQENPNIQINDSSIDCSIPPIHVACLLGEFDCAKVLLQHEADLLAKDMYGLIPFHYACKRGNVGLVKYFTEEYAKVDPDIVRNMLAAHDSNGNTPLHYAAMSSSAELVVHLLALGACSLEENAIELIPSEMCGNEEVKRILNEDEDKQWGELTAEGEEDEEKLSAKSKEDGNY